MNKKFTKGQSAVEYLMTYGWAILIIIIVGIVMWKSGILDISRTTVKDKRGFNEVVPLDWAVQGQEDELEIVVQNDAGTMLDLEQIYMSFMSGGSGSCQTEVTDPILVDFRPGAVQNFTLRNCAITEDLGEYYKINVTIEYTNKASTLIHLSYGTMWGPIE